MFFEPSEPEPDVSVVAGAARDYSLEHPARPVLVVEVSESSLAHDRHDGETAEPRAGDLGVAARHVSAGRPGRRPYAGKTVMSTPIFAMISSAVRWLIPRKASRRASSSVNGAMTSSMWPLTVWIASSR